MGFRRLWLGDQLEQLFRFYFEPAGDFHDSIKFDICLPTLHTADEIAVNGTHPRKRLLREPPFNPQIFHLLAEQIQCAGHAVWSFGSSLKIYPVSGCTVQGVYYAAMVTEVRYEACWIESDGMYSCGCAHHSIDAAIACVMPDGRTFIRAIEDGKSRQLNETELTQFVAASNCRFRSKREKVPQCAPKAASGRQYPASPSGRGALTPE
jgi:hypothetical protein